MAFDDCYHKLASVLGPDIEPLQGARAAEAHRQAWRPERPRVVLLAESHVYTSLEDLQASGSFARIVYCLGYGEPTLAPTVRHNAGTPQFWKVLYSCLSPVESNADFAPILKSRTRSSDERLSNKRFVLKALRARGIWLLDASIVALYRPGFPKPSPAVLRAALAASWHLHVEDTLRQASPAYLIVIGHGVAAALGARLHSLVGDRIAVLPQPQARLPADEHRRAFRQYFRICSEFAPEEHVVSNPGFRAIYFPSYPKFAVRFGCGR